MIVKRNDESRTSWRRSITFAVSQRACQRYVTGDEGEKEKLNHVINEDVSRVRPMHKSVFVAPLDGAAPQFAQPTGEKCDSLLLPSVNSIRTAQMGHSLRKKGDDMAVPARFPVDGRRR